MCSIFLCERIGLPPSWRRIGGSSMTQLHFLGNITPFVIRCFSSSKQHSFTVSYLMNSCGLSPETALSASRKVQFETPERADSVLALLRNYGCTNTHLQNCKQVSAPAHCQSWEDPFAQTRVFPFRRLFRAWPCQYCRC